MGNFQQEEASTLVQDICALYEQISSLDSLKPSKNVDTLFTKLVSTCIPPAPHLNITNLPKDVQEIRSKLIILCGEAEGFLESHFSTILASYKNPIENLSLFPYYNNYLKLSLLEFNILTKYCTQTPNKIAFVGSGPLPLTSIVLALNHLPTTSFHNYDIDPLANSRAISLIPPHHDLSNRMFFHTSDVLDVIEGLKEYDVVFLAALVGLNKEEKVRVIEHLAKYMAPGAYLMLRSAHGARAFLYPVVDASDLNLGFEVLTVFHPTDEVINSVVLARKAPVMAQLPIELKIADRHHETGHNMNSLCIFPYKCSHDHHLNMIEEFAMEEQLS